MRELSAVRVELSNLHSSLDEMTVLVQRVKNDVRSLLSTVFKVVQTTYEDVIGAVKRNVQKKARGRVEEDGDSISSWVCSFGG